ncbi:uncharacterized protein HGUI_00526 [Hanseniaspora guilliermondii]|uniref:DNL-type domain-containing protein n=1 Tax=Hanseniaspora guilliermondii TaxID=56406 RepID=A0A1L0FFH1_9ASCO|nr:uncharacterized protein HGUI_00526 [Hanseniaspora guilliermondii]
MFRNLLIRNISKKFNSIKIPYNPNDKLLLVFTCNKCQHRSSHQITKHGYYKGSVICECPQCKNRHLISDHMKIFQDNVQNLTLADILKKKGVEISYDINALKDNEVPEELKETIQNLKKQASVSSDNESLLPGDTKDK